MTRIDYIIQNDYLCGLFGTLISLLIFVYVVKWMWREDDRKAKKLSFDESLQDKYQKEMIGMNWCEMTQAIYARIAHSLENGKTISPRMMSLYKDLIQEKLRPLQRPIQRAVIKQIEETEILVDTLELH